MDKDARLNRSPALAIERGRKVRFTFDGRPIKAFEGETVAGALYAAGARIFSRSSKYHRPRGLFCLAGHCGQCMMRVDGLPNVRTCITPVRDGMRVESQNAWPSLKFDLASIADNLDFLIRPGFQYRWFKRQRRLYHWWERFLRQMAGSGTLPEKLKPGPVRRREASPELVVVGAGPAGLSAAGHAAEAGAPVWLLEKESSLGGHGRYDPSPVLIPGSSGPVGGPELAAGLVRRVEALGTVRIIKDTAALAWYDEGLLLAAGPGECFVLKPRGLVIAAGSYDQPMLFGNNDLPGIFLGRGLQRLMHRDGVRPGRRAVVATDHDDGYELAGQMLEVGVEVAAVVDQRPGGPSPASGVAGRLAPAGVPLLADAEIKEALGRGRVRAVVVGPMPGRVLTTGRREVEISCDVVGIAGARSPADELIFQRTCRGEYVLASPCHYVRRPPVTPHRRIEPGLYVAGEAGGSRGAARAYLEGRIAGLAAALELGFGGEAERTALETAAAALEELESAPGL
ncbi:MAG: 2Fe-2S iron-sulfur cluster-binding protein [Thermodesulfobacteriota bacterium]